LYNAYYNLGVAYAGHKDDADKALEYFNKAVEIQPDHMLAGYGIKMIEKLKSE
jgi:tetratricopeptide (TPR) repeat protein